MATTDQTPKLVRGAGLPADGDKDHYFGFDQQGNAWALQWSDDHGAWTGTGFRGKWPAQAIFRGDAKSEIVSFIGPVSAI